MIFNLKNGFITTAHIQLTPNKSSGKNRAELIVVHDTASGVDNTKGVVDWLCNPAAKASAHFVVGVDGEIWQLGSTDSILWHTGKSSYKGRAVGNSCNSFSIGIEIVNPGWLIDGEDGYAYHSQTKKIKWPIDQVIKKDSENHTEKGRYWLPYTKPQLDAVFAICKAITEEYSITDIVPHWEISPGRKQDTNPLFPLEELRETMFPDTKNSPSLEDLVASIPDVSKKEKTASGGVKLITTDPLNIREFPNWKSGILAELPKSFVFVPDIFEDSDKDGKIDWYKVTYKNVSGYVSASYVKEYE